MAPAGSEWPPPTTACPSQEDDREEFFLLAVLAPAQRDEWTALKQRKEETEKKLAAVPKARAAYVGTFVQPSEPVRSTSAAIRWTRRDRSTREPERATENVARLRP